ncbi:MAG: hypothetical protein H6584_08545 [Flavobacteriales bacterium]|nr:hypothetical protein [Flavobacteriales bacterium]
MELIEMLINTRKATVLKKIKAILEDEQEHLTDDDYKIINARRENHLNGLSKSYSWQEARQKIQSR